MAAALPRGTRHRMLFRALPHGEVRAALEAVRESDAWLGIRLCLEFVALTATEERRGAEGALAGDRPGPRNVDGARRAHEDRARTPSAPIDGRAGAAGPGPVDRERVGIDLPQLQGAGAARPSGGGGVSGPRDPEHGVRVAQLVPRLGRGDRRGPHGRRGGAGAQGRRGRGGVLQARPVRAPTRGHAGLVDVSRRREGDPFRLLPAVPGA